MRALALFVAGTLAGLAANSLAQNRGPNQGVIGLNHVGIIVPDIDQAVDYYTKTLGFPEAFRLKDASGQVQVVYLQVSRNTFVELLSSNAQPSPGVIHHFGLQVENMAAAREMFKARGASVGEASVVGTKSIMSSIADPSGIRIELHEFPPDSVEAQAIERWK